MKMLQKTLVIALGLLCLQSCNNNSSRRDGYGDIQDTINVTDSKGLKQGSWIIYRNDTLIERGKYSNGKKEGVWIYFNLDGTIKEKVTYNNDQTTTN